MNLRILKKKSKSAAKLLEKHAPGQYDISLADGDETLDAPCKFPQRQQRHGFTEPLKNTPLVWFRTCWETPEYDCKSAVDIWEEFKYWVDINPEQLEALKNGK